MRCPRDKKSLKTREYVAGVYVDECPVCRGIWLDKGELEKLEKTDTTPRKDYTEDFSQIPDLMKGAFERAAQRAEEPLTCPKCRVVTETAEYAYCSQVIMNRCSKCGGIWLDRGELETIEKFYEQMHRKGHKLWIGSLLRVLRSEEGKLQA